MKLKVQEFIAAILLILTGFISIPRSLHYVGIVSDYKFDFITISFSSLSLFIQHVATVLLILTPLVALLSGLLIIMGQRKLALYGAVTFIVIRIVTIALTLVWLQFFTEFEISFKTYFIDTVLGKVNIWVEFDGRIFPRIFFHLVTFIFASIALGLIFIGRNQVPFSGSHQSGASQLSPLAPALEIPVAPISVGMKKCPDCAELIQGEAVKCRFCNYRYE